MGSEGRTVGKTDQRWGAASPIHTIFFMVSPGAGRLVFWARTECGEQLLLLGLVQRKAESVAQNSSPKYLNRLTRSGERKSQLLLLKVLCGESKRPCVSGNKNFRCRFILYGVGSRDDAS